jgi:hypothetical protein
MTALRIDLSWPAAELSPNARKHHMVVSRFKKAAKIEAGWATKIARPFDWSPPEGQIPIHLIAHPPLAWRTGDADNLVSRCKGPLMASPKCSASTTACSRLLPLNGRTGVIADG